MVYILPVMRSRGVGDESSRELTFFSGAGDTASHRTETRLSFYVFGEKVFIVIADLVNASEYHGRHLRIARAVQAQPREACVGNTSRLSLL